MYPYLEAIQTMYVVLTWELRNGYEWEITERMYFAESSDAGHFKWEMEEFYRHDDGIKFEIDTVLVYRYSD